ncbi:TlpA disulfide reductase family protein [Rufibacter roseus]|uniref:Redoxin domain-containing protein n=2 Tax=Rufibacter roseus TaxID=1567108 RepID=A0ABW2DIC3_9BACT|nr:TlpA disulfide reductase family protein [Rufibacter roseus]
MPFRLRTLLYSLSLFLVQSLFIASSFAQGTVTISGKISNAISDSVLLEVYTVPASYTGESYSAPVSSKGEFTIQAPLAEPMVAELVHGSESILLYLQPGDNLDVRVNANDFVSSIKFKGKGTNENNFLVQFERKFLEEEDYQVLPENIHKPEKSFLQFLEERRQDQLAFLEKSTKNAPVSEKFKQYVQAQIDFSYANDRLTYVEVRKRVGDLPPTLSTGYYDFLKQVDLNQPGAIRNQAYLDFLYNYFQFKALTSKAGNPERDYYPIMYAMAKKELRGMAKDMMLARILSQSIRFGYIPDTDAMYQEFLQEKVNPLFASYVENQYRQIRKVGMGSKAPGFTLLSSTGDSVSLKSLQGKIVYLGFWRTSCGICNVDQHAYKYFAEQLAAKDIVLVQISVGEDVAVWRQKAAKQNQSAIQLYAPNLSDEVVKNYDVKNFPSYFLIAPDGTIITTNARRPGHAEGAREVAALVDQYRQISSR